MENNNSLSPSENLLKEFKGQKFRTILADPPWQFQNRTGKMAPEHKRLYRYHSMTFEEIKELPVSILTDEKCHLYDLVQDTEGWWS